MISIYIFYSANSNKDPNRTDSEFDHLLKKLDYTICCSNKSEKRKIFFSNDNIHGKIFNVKIVPQEESSKPLKFIKLNPSDITNKSLESKTTACVKQASNTDSLDENFQLPPIGNTKENRSNMKVTFVGIPISTGKYLFISK